MRRFLCAMICGAGMLAGVQAQPPAVEWGTWTAWGDQGNGLYLNPVIPSDYSDIDCIRVGDDYYAISSTFQFSPGMTVLHSKDLVNWEICGNAVADLAQIGPELDWTACRIIPTAWTETVSCLSASLTRWCGGTTRETAWASTASTTTVRPAMWTWTTCITDRQIAS